jgi:hypothetical protein
VISTPIERRPILSSGSGVVIREASFQDHEGIAALQSRNGLATRTVEDWWALWAGNPAYENAPFQPPLGWVLENQRRQIVGYLGNVPLAYYFRGRDIRAATAYSWAVDPNYRRHSIQLLERFLSQKNVDLFVFGTVNAASEAVYRALRFSKAPAGVWNKSAFWITSYREFVGAALRAQPIGFPEWLLRPVSSVLALKDLYSRPWRAQRRSSNFEICHGFDARFDMFWEDLKKKNANRLLAVRDRETLDWHFRKALSLNQAWVLAACDGGRIVAAAIFDRWDMHRLKLKRLRFVDFQALPGFEDTLPSAIRWMVRHCRSNGIHIAENVGCWLDNLGVPGAAAPHRRKLKSWTFYYKARDKELAEALKDPGCWFPTSFDGDTSL